MREEEKERVLRYLRTSGQKRAVIRLGAAYYLCEVKESLTAWENQPYDELCVTEIPEPVALL